MILNFTQNNLVAGSPEEDHPRVLVAEDDPIFRRLLQKRLQDWGFQVVAVEDGTKAWQILQDSEQSPKLVILDWLMPGIGGLELCRRIRTIQGLSYRYVLLISSRDNKRDVIKGLEAGADDYLTKPFDTAELRARIRTGTRILLLEHDLLRAQEELRFRATHDSLTGVWNRAAALDLLRRELERGQRENVPTGIMMIDLDHFKKVNDNYGHLVGDVILKEVASRITESLRSYDFVGRYGGEEFIAILASCSADDLRTVAERARAAVAANPIIVEGVAVHVSVSIGCVEGQQAAVDLQLLAIADAALYEAKRDGRNRVVIGSRTTVAPDSRGVANA